MVAISYDRNGGAHVTLYNTATGEYTQT